MCFFFFQAEDGIRDLTVTGVQTCALPILARFDGEGLRPVQASAEVGHQAYPLIDTETSTEPVPVYKRSRPPEPTARARWRLVALTLVALAAAAALYLVKRSLRHG